MHIKSLRADTHSTASDWIGCSAKIAVATSARAGPSRGVASHATPSVASRCHSRL